MDGRQILKAKTRVAMARRARKGHRAGSMGPDGIGEEIAARSLEQDGGVIDKGDAQAGPVHLSRRRWAGGGGNPCRPRAGFPVFNPPEELAETVFGSPGVEKSTAAKMFVQRIPWGLDGARAAKRAGIALSQRVRAEAGRQQVRHLHSGQRLMGTSVENSVQRAGWFLRASPPLVPTPLLADAAGGAERAAMTGSSAAAARPTRPIISRRVRPSGRGAKESGCSRF